MTYSNVDSFLMSYPRMVAVNSGTIYEYLQRASAFIDSELATVITVPVTPIPRLLVDMENDLANAFYARRHVYEAEKDGALQRVLNEVDAALAGIRRGRISLVVSGTQLTNRELPWSNVKDYHPTFGMLDIQDVHVDKDRLLDEEAIMDTDFEG